MIVAIDGPAGVGKSSLARRIAEERGFFNLNSGSFYRAVALRALDSGFSENDEAAIVRAAELAQLDLVDGRLHLDGADVECRLRNDGMDHLSSVISVIPAVRHAVNRHLRRIAEGMNPVAEGRDMTTVVFPGAEIKIFLDAAPEVRARRRFEQGSNGMNLKEIEASIRERDHRDRNKKEGSLTVSEEAMVLDTSTLTLDDVYERVNQLLHTFL